MSKSLVLVVGAGASKEAALPLGVELKTRIAQALDIRYEYGRSQVSGDQLIDHAIRVICKERGDAKVDINAHLNACRMIRDAMPQAASIDNYIDAHRDNLLVAECGKLAIARCILEAEAKSKLRVDERRSDSTLNFKNLEDSWYNAFFRTLVEGCRFADFSDRLSRVAVITFNYDRCIETYLHGATRNYYQVSAADATEALSRLAMYHPYGDIGPLPWKTHPQAIEFGGDVNASQLAAIRHRIKTFTEGIDESHTQIVEIRATLREAKRVAYLGFAFNRQNVSLLYGAGTGGIPTGTPVYATAYGLSTSDAEMIGRELAQIGGYQSHNVRLQRDATCAQLFHEFGRGLSLA